MAGQLQQAVFALLLQQQLSYLPLLSYRYYCLPQLNITSTLIIEISTLLQQHFHYLLISAKTAGSLSVQQ
jgi:hypothetical protein